jgi:hypothetical protein
MPAMLNLSKIANKKTQFTKNGWSAMALYGLISLKELVLFISKTAQHVLYCMYITWKVGPEYGRYVWLVLNGFYNRGCRTDNKIFVQLQRKKIRRYDSISTLRFQFPRFDTRDIFLRTQRNEF